MLLLLEIMALLGTSASPTTFGEKAAKAFWLEGVNHLLEVHHHLLVSQNCKPAQAVHIMPTLPPGSQSQGGDYPVRAQKQQGAQEFLLWETPTPVDMTCNELCANETLLIWNSGIFMYLPGSYLLPKKSENLNYSRKEKMYFSFL